MIRVELVDSTPMSMVIETMKRVGIRNNDDRTFSQLCFIVDIRGEYYIAYYTELYSLTRQEGTDLCEIGQGRLRSTVILLEQWGMITVVDDIDRDAETEYMTVMKYKEIENGGWSAMPKFNMVEFSIWVNGIIYGLHLNESEKI